MDFWTFCEKLSGFVGIELVMRNIFTVRDMWRRFATVEEVAKEISKKFYNGKA